MLGLLKDFPFENRLLFIDKVTLKLLETIICKIFIYLIDQNYTHSNVFYGIINDNTHNRLNFIEIVRRLE